LSEPGSPRRRRGAPAIGPPTLPAFREPTATSRSTLEGPALALVELESIARGIVAADHVAKRAQVKIALAEPISPGKFLLLFHGGVADVEESFAAAQEAGGPLVLDRLFLPQAAPPLLDALEGRFALKHGESVGIVETHTVAAAVLAADTALKRAEVSLLRLHLARGIGGKGYFLVSGSLHMTQEALEAVEAVISAPLLVATELIQSPHTELDGTVF
jgi:microcompartment protein CcmL/EutN